MGELRGASVTLAEILAYIKQTRRAGRLLIRADAGADPARLFFEDGRLIDARQGAEAGDDVVYRLLGRRDASYTFDRLPASALPTERSVSPMQEMLVLAAIGALAAPEPEPPPVTTPAPVTASAPAAAPVATIAPARRRGRHCAGRRADRHDPCAAPPGAPVPAPQRHPLPPGAPAFADRPLPADFSRLLNLLERDQLSGYVTWFSDGAEGLLLLYYGQVIDAFWAEAQAPATFAEKLAVRRFAAAVDTAGERHVEVYRLDPDFVWSYSSLAYGAYRSGDQGMDRVQFAPLIDRLERSGHTGCVKVVVNSHAVYVFFCRGRALGEFRALPMRWKARRPAPRRRSARNSAAWWTSTPRPPRPRCSRSTRRRGPRAACSKKSVGPPAKCLGLRPGRWSTCSAGPATIPGASARRRHAPSKRRASSSAPTSTPS